MSIHSADGITTLTEETYKQITSQMSDWSDNCFRNISLNYYKVDFDPYVNGELIKNPFDKLQKDKYIL